MHKLKKFVKPANIQIISKKPLEHVEIDITYFTKKNWTIGIKRKIFIKFYWSFKSIIKMLFN